MFTTALFIIAKKMETIKKKKKETTEMFTG